MRAMLVLLLALAGASASAQLTMPDGRLNATCAPTPRVPPLPVPPVVARSGLPTQLGGNCTEALVTADSNGAAAGWWCPQPSPDNARVRLFAVKWSAITLPMLIDFGKLALPLVDREAAITEMNRKYSSLHILDMCDVWNPLVARLNAIYPAPLPAVVPWVTIGGSIFTSNGTILTGVTPRKVAPGLACRTDVPAVKSGTARSFYPLAGGAPTERVECRNTTTTTGSSRFQELGDRIRASLEQQRVLLAHASAELDKARAIISP